MTTTPTAVEHGIDDVERARQAGYDAGYLDGRSVRDIDGPWLTALDVAERMGFKRDGHGADLVLTLTRHDLAPKSAVLGNARVWRSVVVDDWLQQHNPRVDLRGLGEWLITAAEHNGRPRGPATAASGPVECAPWCVDADGHGDNAFREDQNCYGQQLPVDLTLEPAIEDGEHDAEAGKWVSCTDRVDVYGYRSGVDGRAEVHLLRAVNDKDLRLTPDEAQQLVEALQLVLGQIHATENGQ